MKQIVKIAEVNKFHFDFTEPVKEPNILKEEIDKIDPLNTTPMDALRILFDLKNKSKDIK